MKNNIFASLFIEALNKADDSNDTAKSLSEILLHIEKTKTAQRLLKSNDNVTRHKDLPGNLNVSRSTSAIDRSNKKTGIFNKNKTLNHVIENDEKTFARELKQKEYRAILEMRPYYFQSIESLQELKAEAKHTFEKASIKYAYPENNPKLKQSTRYYKRAIEEIGKEIQLKIQARLDKGQKIPRSLLVNDGFVMSEEGLKRDEHRRQLIAEEARAEIAYREAISKITINPKSTYPTQEELPIPSRGLESTFSVRSETQLTKEKNESGGEDSIDKKLYYQIIRIMSRDDAWRIAKSKTLSEAYRLSPFQPNGTSYFNSVSYLLLLNAGSNREDALNVAKSRENAEAYLRNSISEYTKNHIQIPKISWKKRTIPSIKSTNINTPITRFLQFHVIDEGIHLNHVFMRTPSLQANFKARVLANFYHTCAVTGQKVEALLQACHIEDYSIGLNMSTDNGILLSADCHRLFDKGLMGIEPDNLTVHFKVKCIYSSLFEGKKISPHETELDKGKLKARWAIYNE